MTSEGGYRPIACGLYSRLEVAILHRTPLEATWEDEAGRRHRGRLLPLDLITRDRAEYLLAETPQGRTEIRLDRLHFASPEKGGSA
ncbi:MAG: transcriptional antiterminator, Rof [Nitrospirae bacterium]|nr:MAG: transcriptional antiterminator, Rof [Nitrospirota bacterium]